MNKITKDLILWGHQWAEYVDDEEVLKLWEEGKNLVIDYGEESMRFDLREYHKQEKEESSPQSYSPKGNMDNSGGETISTPSGRELEGSPKEYTMRTDTTT